MKVNRKYKIEKCVSLDELRPRLSQPYLDAERKLLVAMNGKILVGVPVEVDDLVEASGYVDPAALAAARKAAGRKADSIEVPAAPVDGWTFPAYEQVIPKTKPGDPGTVTFRFDERLLRDLLAGLGSDGSVVELTVPLDAKRPGYSEDYAPILVRNACKGESDPREVAVLMPIGGAGGRRP